MEGRCGWPPNVAIGGRMRAGKTTCAEHLVALRGYVSYALADPIKEIAHNDFGWDGLKNDRGRRLLQELGTAGRAYDPGLWLRRFDAWLAEHRGAPVVVDDLRLPAEADHVRRLGFVVVRIVRPQSPAEAGEALLRSHETEAEADHLRADVVLVNGGTVSELLAALDGALAHR